MNKIKIKKIIIGALILLSLFFYGISVRASDKPKILIYSSHTCETNKDSTITQISEDLSRKLRNKGWEVVHVTDNFSKDYNRSYSASRKMLNNIDLSQFSLIIDCHIDSGNKATTTTINNKEVARIMWVQTKNNPNLESETKIANGISDKLSKFGEISKGIYAEYFKGINYYNCDKSPNIVLLEMGNENNTYMECRLSNTYVASAIDSYLNNKN